jgi:hypothetical protein
MKTMLFFWRQDPATALPPASIAAELHAGNEVEGLIDLPVQEILVQLKGAFPDAVEKAGELMWRKGEESFEATWSWQHVSFHGTDLADDTRSRLIAVLEAYDCGAYDAQLGIRLEP